MKKVVVASIVFAVLLSIAVVIILKYQKAGNKLGYVINSKVFEEFNGTKDKMKVLKKSEEKLKFNLDSIAAEYKVISQHTDPASRKKAEWIKVRYEELSKEYSLKYEGQQNQYTEELWNQINQYMISYGQEKKYDMIYGASGSGSIMYADSTLNLTNDFIKYINIKYEGK